MTEPIYKFPYDNFADYPGTISFTRIVVTPPTVNANAEVIDDLFNTLIGGSEEETNARNDNVGGVSVSNRKIELKETVKLYLPSSILLNDGIQYDNNVQLSIAGAVGEAALNNGETLGGALAKAMEAGLSSFTDLFRGVSAPDVARLGIARGASFLPGPAAVVSDLAQSAFRTTINPNKRTLFRGVLPREYTFQFKMIANSAREAQEIDNIVKFFRTAMYPTDIILGAGITGGYNYPDMFSISMKYNGNQVGHRIKYSYLTSMAQTLNPSSMGYHVDGKPSEVDLSLSFFEETTISRKDVEEGF